MKQFKYNVVKLMNAIKDQPSIWDKTADVYKDRNERKAAWDEVFTTLEPNYESMSKEDQRMISETVTTKWTNLRDTYLRSLRNKFGKPKRKYIYHEHMSFMNKALGISENTSLDALESGNEGDEGEEDSRYFEEESPKSPPPQKRPKKSAVFIIPSNDEPPSGDEAPCGNTSFLEYDGTHEPRVMNEDEAFFASLLPTVVRYSLEERLEFRMDVLRVMKKINDKRKWGNCDNDGN